MEHSSFNVDRNEYKSDRLHLYETLSRGPRSSSRLEKPPDSSPRKSVPDSRFPQQSFPLSLVPRGHLCEVPLCSGAHSVCSPFTGFDPTGELSSFL